MMKKTPYQKMIVSNMFDDLTTTNQRMKRESFAAQLLLITLTALTYGALVILLV